MKNLNIFMIAAVMLLTVQACNKTKKYSKRLAGETWAVKTLTVDGTSEEELPTLVFEDCDIYDEVCMGEWTNPEGAHAEFAWQIREKGKIFELSNQSNLEGDGHDHGNVDEHAQEEAILQCQNFSGIYEIKEHKKKSMRFESKSTIGFPGQAVVIELELK